MRIESFVVCAFAVLAGACQPRIKVATPEKEVLAIAQTGVQPQGEIKLVGSFDFDVVGDVSGAGCFDPQSRGMQLGIVPGAGLGNGASFASTRAQGAAVYDALTKAKDADTILVTWTKIETTPDGNTCAEVHGKAIKLKKGPTTIPDGEHARIPHEGPPHPPPPGPATQPAPPPPPPPPVAK